MLLRQCGGFFYPFCILSTLFLYTSPLPSYRIIEL
nr:MAG TPA: hypothetical protein [Caudoviricetes sp.]